MADVLNKGKLMMTPEENEEFMKSLKSLELTMKDHIAALATRKSKPAGKSAASLAVPPAKATSSLTVPGAQGATGGAGSANTSHEDAVTTGPITRSSKVS